MDTRPGDTEGTVMRLTNLINRKYFGSRASGIRFPPVTLAVTFLDEPLGSEFPKNLLVSHVSIFVPHGERQGLVFWSYVFFAVENSIGGVPSGRKTGEAIKYQF